MPIPADGTYYYRVAAVNALGTESAPSNLASATLDTTPPRAVAIVYTPQGASDPQTGRVAQGRVDIELSVSEPLLTTPFLSLATDGGAPLTALLEKVADTQYQGYLEITPYAGSGTAYAVFSARDLVGNRGTAIDAGATLEIDTRGPAAVRIDLLPAHPVRNDAANAATRTANLGVTVTPSGKGRVLFKVEDIYTLTRDTAGNLITGLEGATIRLQNEQLATVGATVTSGPGGEVLTGALPAGSYRYRATMPDHTDTSGRLRVRAGIVSSERLFLDSQVVSVEWSVTETTIQDVYNITLHATYQTNVPTAVIALEPSTVNLPYLRAGEVFYGELTLANYGLIAAVDVHLNLPVNDPYLRYEVLFDSVPTVLGAKQRVTLPYRLTALRDFAADASGGGCFTYQGAVRAEGSSQCANGERVERSAQTVYTYQSGSSCSTAAVTPDPGNTCVGDLCGGGSGIGPYNSDGGPDYGGTEISDGLSGLPSCRPPCNDCSKGQGSGSGG